MNAEDMLNRWMRGGGATAAVGGVTITAASTANLASKLRLAYEPRQVPLRPLAGWPRL